MKTLISLAISSLFILSSVHADIQVDVNNKNGGKSRFSSNGQVVRMDDLNSASYGLINLATDEVKMVDIVRQEVMDLSGMSAPSFGAPMNSMPLHISLKELGAGPRVAGYSTRKVQIFANGNDCGTILASLEAKNEPGMQHIFKAMEKMVDQSKRMSAGFRSMQDICEQADFENSSTFQKIGAPMRIINEKGQIESEISRIDTRAITEPNFYQVPKHFRVTSMQDQMNQAQQQNQQMMQQYQKHMPDMNRMLQQMQQSGAMPPEAMDRIKQMQEMIQQQYPQQ